MSTAALLGTAGLLLGVIGAPALASADSSGNITVLSAGPDVSGDPYDLTVVADDGNGLIISAMTAHVYSASGQDVADVPMRAQSTADPSQQTFAAQNPIAPADLPAGTYTVTVDAADADESDSAIPAPGSFTFSYTASTLVVAPAPPTVTLGAQSITFSGTLTGTAPGGGGGAGIPNAPVSLSIAGGTPSVVATTDANGNFSYPVPGISQTADYNFSVPGTSTYPAASDDVTVPVEQATTSIVASPDPAAVTEGIQSVTFTGTVSASVPEPAPDTSASVNVGSGVPVYLSIGSGAPQEVTTTDDATGDFSYTSPDTEPGTYTFSVNPTSLYTSASFAVTVYSQAAPTTLAVTPSQPAVTFGSQSVTFAGSVTADPQGASSVGVPDAPVYLSIGSGAPQQVTTTDGNGNFSYPVSGITTGTDYDFSVDATPLYDGASDDVSIPLVQGQTALTVSASPADGNLSAKSVTFSGTALVTPSGGSAGAPIGAGVPVYLSISGQPATQVAVTGANGTFTYDATGPTEPADYNFEIQPGVLYTQAADEVPLGPSQQSALSVKPSATSVTKGAQSVTFSGMLTGTAPGSATPNDIQNVPVWLSVNGGQAKQIATTGSSGDFSYKVTGLSKTTTYTFSVDETSSYTSAAATMAIGVTPAATRISGIRVSPAHLKYGQKATLTGSVQYLHGTVWTAMPGTTVQLAESAKKVGSVVTSSAGKFTATLPTTHGPGWTATVAAAALTRQATATGNLSIAAPLKVKSFSASLGVNDHVSVAGCLEVTAPVGYGPQTSVAIQYRARTTGAWKSLGKLRLYNRDRQHRTCPDADESYFSGSLAARLASAYYRAHFAATDSFQSATSRDIHAWKYPTRVVSFSVKPRSVSQNGYVTIKARLEVRRSRWQGWGGQLLSFIYNYQGTSAWRSLGGVRTNSSGYVTLRVRGTTGSFVAVTYAAYGGNKTHLASRSTGIDISVNNGTPSQARPAVPDLGQLPALPVPMVPAFGPAGPPISELAAKP